MEVVHILKSLWMSKALVAIGAVLALAAAIALGVRGQTATGGVASAEVLIDAQESAISDLRPETLSLVTRSGILARVLGVDGATDMIARKAGVPASEIAVLGPAPSVDGVPDQASAERAAEFSESASHLVQVQREDEVPLITIFAQAPTTAGARRLADATAAALEKYVSDYHQPSTVPERRQVKVRQLGPTQASEYKETPGVVLPFVVFSVIFGLWCFAILAWPSIKAAWRSPEAAEPSSSLIVVGGASHTSNGGPTSTRGAILHRGLAPERRPAPAGDESKSEDEADAAAERESEGPDRLASTAKPISGD